MFQLWVRVLSARTSRGGFGVLSRTPATLQSYSDNPFAKFCSNQEIAHLGSAEVQQREGLLLNSLAERCVVTPCLVPNICKLPSVSRPLLFRNVGKFCTLSGPEMQDKSQDFSGSCNDIKSDGHEFNVDANGNIGVKESIMKHSKLIDFTKIDIDKLPTVIIIGRPNVGKSALFNRLIRRREALVYNTPTDHVTRDIRDGVAKLGDLRFRALDSAGLEAEASSGSVLSRTAEMTKNVLARSQIALFLIDGRDGLQDMDLDVGRWLRKQAPGIKTIVVINKAEMLDAFSGSLAATIGEAYSLGFGDPVTLSAETGLGMSELHEALKPLLEDYVLQVLPGRKSVLMGDIHHVLSIHGSCL